MCRVVVFGLLLTPAGAAPAEPDPGLRVRVVDARTGEPIPGATVARWASEWQPRILRPPAKFWFPAGKGAATDRDGSVAMAQVAGDDRYYATADGYERGFVARRGSKFELTDTPGGKPRELTPESGVLVIPLRPRPAK